MKTRSMLCVMESINIRIKVVSEYQDDKSWKISHREAWATPNFYRIETVNFIETFLENHFINALNFQVISRFLLCFKFE